MRSHVVSTIKKTPDQICLLVGTNDLKSSTPNDVADAIIDLAREVENASESEIVLSELTARNDDISVLHVDFSALLHEDFSARTNLEI